jgi:hypothetical protein
MRHTTRASIAVVAVAAVGFGGCTTDSGDGAQRNRSVPSPVGGDSPAERPIGPTFAVRGVPQGWRHDAVGARAAAVSAVELTGEIARSGFITRGDMIKKFASDRFALELIEVTDRQLAELSEALGEVDVAPPQLTWTEIALTARVVSDNPDRVGVEVWSVLVVATPEAGVPRQAWRTVELELVWEDEDWKVDAWTARAGPTPALAAGAAVSSVEEITDVAGWPAAGVALEDDSVAGGA